MTAVCLLQRKGNEAKEFYVTAQDLIDSGMTRNDNGSFDFKRRIWKKDKKTGKYSQVDYFSDTWRKFWKRHWTRRCRSVGLKDEFGDVLQGRKIFEYDYQPPSEEEDQDGQKIKKVEGFIQK